mmetsp:Transcript_23600/g.43606  ORF Transcript_23600/g.43606 Transcript_23600/m.43606 type:complete len:88 (-) Transcript_23600:662-925(-)
MTVALICRGRDGHSSIYFISSIVSAKELCRHEGGFRPTPFIRLRLDGGDAKHCDFCSSSTPSATRQSRQQVSIKVNPQCAPDRPYYL